LKSMKTTENHSQALPSSFGSEVTVRLTRLVAETLYRHMRADSAKEQLAFALASPARTTSGTVLIVNELLLPAPEDLGEQTSVSLCPTADFQGLVYFQALQRQKVIIEFHSHPGGGVPGFSGTDQRHSRLNAEYIRDRLPAPMTLGLVVGNNTFTAFDGSIFDRHLGQFRPINRLEVLGRPSEIRYMGEAVASGFTPNEQYDRQARIPLWNQLGLERQRIGIAGLGGNGSPLFETLIGIGAGRQGWLAVIDPGLIESSNLPRMPFAYPDQVGVPKVAAAAAYGSRKSPGTPVYPFPCQFRETAVQNQLKAATVIIGCGDNDGLRKELSQHAVRYGIPYIDLGCDIQPDGEGWIAAGQVSVALPGENACPVCRNGFDAAQAALDQMDDIAQAQSAARGYFPKAAAATPSIANLNQLTVHYALAQLLSLVNGPQFAEWDYLYLNPVTGRTIPARTERRADCPLCGPDGCLNAGDPIPGKGNRAPALRLLTQTA
jgi:hypothetical protein